MTHWTARPGNGIVSMRWGMLTAQRQFAVHSPFLLQDAVKLVISSSRSG